MLSADNSLVFVLTHMYIQAGGSGTYRYLHTIRTADGQPQYTALQFAVSNSSGFDSLARDADDRVYFTAVDVDGNGVLYGVQNGAVFISITINNLAGPGNYVAAVGSPAVDADGVIYFGVNIYTNGSNTSAAYVYAVTNDGTIKWQKELPNGFINGVENEFNTITSSPSIAYNGDIIITTEISNLEETNRLSRVHKISS